MKKIVNLVAPAILMAGICMPASAFDQSKMYVGGGMSSNSHDASNLDSAIGYQFFAGYDLSDLISLGDGIGFAAEAGYMSSGDFDYKNNYCGVFNILCDTKFSADGLWTTAVIDYQINDTVKVLGRLGLDLGDDDGLIFGGGGAFQVNEKIALRGEYVIRPNYSSLQANVVYAF